MGETYLVGRVADTDIKVWKIRFDHISKQHFQSLCFWFPLHPLRDFGGHARVKLDRYDALCFFEDLDCEIAGAGAYFEDYLGFWNVSMGVASFFRWIVGGKGHTSLCLRSALSTMA